MFGVDDLAGLDNVPEYWIQGGAKELIHRGRRQVLVHSILYYQLDKSIISDTQFDVLARRLARLQREFPDDSNQVLYHREAFLNFDGETGFHLPLTDYRANQVAIRMWHHYHSR